MMVCTLWPTFRLGYGAFCLSSVAMLGLWQAAVKQVRLVQAPALDLLAQVSARLSRQAAFGSLVP